MSHRSGHIIVNVVIDDNGNNEHGSKRISSEHRSKRIEIEPGMTVDQILEAVRAVLEEE